jgi:hypothetical protein
VLAVLAGLGFVSSTRFIHITYSIGRIAFAPANIAPDRSFEHLRELVRIADGRAIRATFTVSFRFRARPRPGPARSGDSLVPQLQRPDQPRAARALPQPTLWVETGRLWHFLGALGAISRLPHPFGTHL